MLNKILCVAFTVSFIGCSSAPEPVEKVIGERVQYDIALADGLDDNTIAMMTMRDVKDQVYRYMNNDNKPSAKIITVLVNAPSGNGYLLGFNFNIDDLAGLNFSKDMPYQELMKFVKVDRKMKQGDKIIDAWCLNQSIKVATVCS